MPDSLGHPPELNTQPIAAVRHADVVFGRIFDFAFVAMSVLALLLL